MLLSDSKIRNAKAKAKQYKLSDGEGLYLLVHPNGSKYWQFKYHYAEKARVLSIGKYPRVKLAEARERKLEAQRLLRDNTDPSNHKQQEKRLAVYRDKNSFYAVAKQWHERNKDSWTAHYAQDTWNRLANHIFPHLGKRAISEIKPLELLTVIQKIERRGKTDMSHRVLRICSAVYDYAIITGRAEQNITLSLSKALKPHRAKNYPTLRAKEITKMRTEHIVPLSRQVIKLLIKLHSITGASEWLLDGRVLYREGLWQYFKCACGSNSLNY